MEAEDVEIILGLEKNLFNRIFSRAFKSFEGKREGGFGINNMMMRARKINAKIDLVPIAGGAILTIYLP